MLHTFEIMKKKEEEFWFAYSDEDSMPNSIIDKSLNLSGTKDKLILALLEKNLMAWETSKEKREGIMPEIYENMKSVYEEITGKKFKFIEVKEKYK